MKAFGKLERTAAALLTLMTVVVLLAVEWHAPARVEAREQPAITVTKMLDGVTTGSSVMGAGTMSQCREATFYAVWSAGTSAGVITVETAHDSAYAGTWASLGTITRTAASSQGILRVSGVYAAVRTRVSTTVADGTVTTWVVCN